MEILSSSLNSTSTPIYLVIQSPDAIAQGYNAANSGLCDVHQLPFEPSDDFHEYRFDWTRNGVIFYADGVPLKTMLWSYPTDTPGRLVISHWSNGNLLWSKGPPQRDAVTTISYVKAYYNSSDPVRNAAFHARCPGSPDVGSICPIEDQVVVPTAVAPSATSIEIGGTGTAGAMIEKPTTTRIASSIATYDPESRASSKEPAASASSKALETCDMPWSVVAGAIFAFFQTALGLLE